MKFVYNSKENFLKEAQHKSIVCFGAGDTFMQFLYESENWKVNVNCIWDNDIAKQGQYIMFHDKMLQICSPSPANLNADDFIFLITGKAVKEIRNQLQKMGFENMIFSFPFYETYPDSISERKRLRMGMPVMKMLNQYFKEFDYQESEKKYWIEKTEEKLENGIVIPYMTALVTSKCTLRCRDCNNLMPYCKKSRIIEKEVVIQDVNRICSAIDYCVCMNITGGEPLLHQDLSDIIFSIAENDKILFTEIITNGTVIPTQRVLKSMKSKKVIVKISNYQQYSKIRELEEIFRAEGIRFLINNDLKWVISGGIERRDKEYDRIKFEYLSCWPGKICKSLWDGKLYACARAAFLHDIGASDHPSDFLNIYEGNLRDSLLNFYLQDYVDACDFCDYMNYEGRTRVEPAIQYY